MSRLSLSLYIFMTNCCLIIQSTLISSLTALQHAGLALLFSVRMSFPFVMKSFHMFSQMRPCLQGYFLPSASCMLLAALCEASVHTPCLSISTYCAAALILLRKGCIFSLASCLISVSALRCSSWVIVSTALSSMSWKNPSTCSGDKTSPIFFM